MQQATAKHLMRYGTGLIMALLLGDVLSPSALRAACGGHVRYSPPGMKDGPASDHLSGSLPARVPCTGPSCSRPEAPPAAPVVPPSPGSDTWGCLAGPPEAPAT